MERLISVDALKPGDRFQDDGVIYDVLAVKRESNCIKVTAKASDGEPIDIRYDFNEKVNLLESYSSNDDYDDDVDEFLAEAAFSGGYASGGDTIDRYARPGGKTSKLNFKCLDGKKTKKVKGKDLKPGMVTEVGKIRKVEREFNWGKWGYEVWYDGVDHEFRGEDADVEVLDESCVSTLTALPEEYDDQF